MKKLSLLIALCLCVIIGGVYATWIFSDQSAAVDSITRELLVRLDDVSTGTHKGTFSMETNIQKFLIDQLGDDGDPDTDNHTAVLASLKDGNEEAYIKIIFKPDPNATEDIKQEGINAQFSISETAAMQFPTDGNSHYQEGGTLVDIFTYETENNPIKIGKVNQPIDGKKWTKEADGTFTYTLNRADIREYIVLNTFILTNKEAYDKFASAVNANFKITISEVTAP